MYKNNGSWYYRDMSKSIDGSVLQQYRLLVEELSVAKARVGQLEAQISAIESGEVQSSSPHVPSRLVGTYKTLRRLGRSTLDDIYRGQSALSRPGVRSQLLKMVELGLARQSGRGEFEPI